MRIINHAGKIYWKQYKNPGGGTVLWYRIGNGFTGIAVGRTLAELKEIYPEDEYEYEAF